MEKSVPEGPVPQRCRRCAQWLGHKSGNDKDQRCNRLWGHEAEHGDFKADGPFSGPAYVKRDCRVPKWGVPLPPMTEAGRPVGPTPSPEMVDAFIPLRDPRIAEIELCAHGSFYSVTPQQIHDYLMSSNSEELLEKFDERQEKRDAVETQVQQHYSDKYGTNPRVREGAEELPPWLRGEEKAPTGIIQLDRALGGGIPIGCAYNISGKNDSGKSTLQYLLAGAHVRYYRKKVFQFTLNTLLPDGDPTESGEASAEKKKEALRIAKEKAEDESIALASPERFNPDYATRAMNLDLPLFDSELSPKEIANQSVRLIDTEFAEETTESLIASLDVDSVDLDEYRGKNTHSWELPISIRQFIWDSIDAGQLAEEHYSGSNQERNRMGDESRVGAQARLLAEFFRKTYKANKVPTTVGLNSQYRASNIGSFASGKSPHRGNAHGYFTDLEMDLWRKSSSSVEGYEEIHVNFEKVHVDANVTTGDEIVIYLKPHEGYNPIDNVAMHVLNDVEQNPDATNGTESLYRNGSWVAYKPPGETEPIKKQGNNPDNVYALVKEAGAENEFYEQILSELSWK